MHTMESVTLSRSSRSASVLVLSDKPLRRMNTASTLAAFPMPPQAAADGTGRHFGLGLGLSNTQSRPSAARSFTAPASSTFLHKLNTSDDEDFASQFIMTDDLLDSDSDEEDSVLDQTLRDGELCPGVSQSDLAVESYRSPRHSPLTQHSLTREDFGFMVSAIDYTKTHSSPMIRESIPKSRHRRCHSKPCDFSEQRFQAPWSSPRLVSSLDNLRSPTMMNDRRGLQGQKSQMSYDSSSETSASSPSSSSPSTPFSSFALSPASSRTSMTSSNFFQHHLDNCGFLGSKQSVLERGRPIPHKPSLLEMIRKSSTVSATTTSSCSYQDSLAANPTCSSLPRSGGMQQTPHHTLTLSCIEPQSPTLSLHSCQASICHSPPSVLNKTTLDNARMMTMNDEVEQIEVEQKPASTLSTASMSGSNDSRSSFVIESSAAKTLVNSSTALNKSDIANHRKSSLSLMSLKLKRVKSWFQFIGTGSNDPIPVVRDHEVGDEEQEELREFGDEDGDDDESLAKHVMESPRLRRTRSIEHVLFGELYLKGTNLKSVEVSK